MAVLKKGTISLDIGFIKLGADFEEADRQCAWELYTEIAMRTAVSGKVNDPDCCNFVGEVYIESLNSLYNFFIESRKIMRQFPVGSLSAKGIENHLGSLIHRVSQRAIRPFLETWQSKYRFWWENNSDKSLPPEIRQQSYPELNEMLSEWSDVRSIMRAIQDQLVSQYKLVDVTKLPL